MGNVVRPSPDSPAYDVSQVGVTASRETLQTTFPTCKKETSHALATEWIKAHVRIPSQRAEDGWAADRAGVRLRRGAPALP